MTDNRQKRNTSTGLGNIKDIALAVRDFVLKNSKIIFPIILIVCVAITVAVALNIGKGDKENKEVASTESVSDGESTGSEASLGIPIPEEGLKNNAVPEVNTLIMDYYNAVTTGDVEKVLTISNEVDETEKIRIQELSKYIESYPTVEIYTKPGPIADSYLAYVYTKVKFNGYENAVPGMQAFYVCKAEDGSYFINEGDEEEYITSYIEKVTLQEDVVELYNKMTVEYNELLVSDTNLGVFLQELATQMDISVGEALAAAELAQEQEAAETTGTTEGGEETPGATQEPTAPEQTGPKQARTTTKINVRSSDSETADKLGQLESGTNLEVLESRPNGWSKIIYEGKEAYVKSDYLEISEGAATAEGITTTGTVTALDNVNVRADANETAEKLGVIYQGEKLDLIQKMDNGWSQVKYKDKVAYVKSEFVE